MEGAESKAKKRVLPEWMTDEKAKPRCLPARNLKRKKEISPGKRTAYCMNEMELVEYALEVLHENCRQRLNDLKSSAEVCNDSEEEEEPQLFPASPVCNPMIKPSPSKDLENNPSVSGAYSDNEDDPLKFVREIFFH